MIWRHGVNIQDGHDTVDDVLRLHVTSFLSWLKKKGIKIHSEDAPNYIQAKRIDVDPWSPEHLSKELSIRITQTANDVNIQIIMDSPNRLAPNILKKAEAYWTFLVEKCWRFIGVDTSIEVMQSLFPKSKLEFLLNDLKYEIIGVAGLLSVFIALFSILTDLSQSTNLFLKIQLLVGAALLPVLFRGPKYLQVRNLLGELYRDT